MLCDTHMWHFTLIVASFKMTQNKTKSSNIAKQYTRRAIVVVCTLLCSASRFANDWSVVIEIGWLRKEEEGKKIIITILTAITSMLYICIVVLSWCYNNTKIAFSSDCMCESGWYVHLVAIETISNRIDSNWIEPNGIESNQAGVEWSRMERKRGKSEESEQQPIWMIE